MPKNDLLTAYAETNNESAFRTLMEQYADLVYGSALRRTGSPQIAEEVLQTVFITLARKARQLKAHPTLAGWLYRATMNEAAKYLSKESKRLKKMKEFQVQQENAASFTADNLPPVDQAIDKLASSDRDLILLRFFEQKSYREIAQTIGKKEAACRKQGERALKRLAKIMRREGAVTGGVLISILTAQFSKAAPAAIVMATTDRVLSTAAATSPGILTTPLQAFAIINSKFALATIVVVWCLVVGVSFRAGRERAQAELSRPILISHSATIEQSQSRPISENYQLTRALIRALLSLAQRDLDQIDFDPTASIQMNVRLKRIPADQLPIALELVDTMPGGLAEHILLAKHLLQFWAENDGASAMAFAYGHLAPSELKDAALRIIGPWASRDPTGAWAWHRSTLKSDVSGGVLTIAEKEAQLESIFAGWARKDTSAAIAEFEKLDTVDEKLHALEGIAGSAGNEAARSDILTFVEELTDPEMRRNAIIQVAKSMGLADAPEVFAWADGANLSDTEKTIVSQAFYDSQHLMSDPGGAADWFISETRSDQQLDARLSIIKDRWSGENPEAFSQWLETVELGPEMDGTIASVGHRFGEEGRHDLSAHWALRITDPSAQSHHIQNLLHNWARQDQVAARQWFENAALTPEVVEQVLKMFKWNNQ